jgi:hypothetical protein
MARGLQRPLPNQEVAMQNNIVLVSLLAATAPFVSACVEATPSEIAPAAAVAFGELSTPVSTTANAPAAKAKSSAPTQAFLFPRDATPFGVSYEDWAAAWWQWAVAIPKDENPMLGGPCELHQSGKVFFLAGTTGGNDIRSCTIPAGKGIFFPLVNVMYKSCPEYGGQFEGYTCEDATSEDLLHQGATEYMGYESTLLLEIDGVSVEGLDAYRAHSDTFVETSPTDVSARVFPFCAGPIEENPCGVPVGSERPAVADGYWAMLRPLSAGQHEIRFAASIALPWGGFSLDVTYDILVTP